MRADDLRILYDYHFTFNQKLWDTSIVTLSDEQFLQKLDYSVGSIRNQMVHMMDVDQGWFKGLRGNERGPFENPINWTSREQIRTAWDAVIADMQVYLDALTDDEANAPFINAPAPTAKWQVMLHVANHGTDHRAQTLAMLHSLGAPTLAQDMIWHFWPL